MNPWGCWGLGPIQDVVANKDKLSAWRSGLIFSQAGELRSVFGRWWQFPASLAHVWLHRRWRSLPSDQCFLHYTRPRSSPGFVSLRYICSGPKTKLATVHRAMVTLDEIALTLDAYAIVCCASNPRLSEKLMLRWGYHRHAHSLPGFHYIKRLRQTLEPEPSLRDATQIQSTADRIGIDIDPSQARITDNKLANAKHLSLNSIATQLQATNFPNAD